MAAAQHPGEVAVARVGAAGGRLCGGDGRIGGPAGVGERDRGALGGERVVVSAASPIGTASRPATGNAAAAGQRQVGSPDGAGRSPSSHPAPDCSMRRHSAVVSRGGRPTPTQPTVSRRAEPSR
jgi:hypothetical protein